MRALVSPDLLVEWERRLDDFEGRGWHNHVEPIGEPSVEYVGLKRTGDADTDHVVVKIDARVKDYVVDRSGRHLKRTGSMSEITRIREFWTLQKRNGHWILASIEQGGEGKHALDEDIVATAWGDEKGMRDEALIEGAVADQVPEGTTVAEVADLQYDGDAHAAAMDLSLADGRFAPDVLEVAARRAVERLGAGDRRRRRAAGRDRHARRPSASSSTPGTPAARYAWSSAARSSTASASSASTPAPSRRR